MGRIVSRIVSRIVIDCPVERVFAYITTPGHWAEWHPSTLGVSGATDHSLEPGEVVVEDVRVAGRTGRVAWTVREHVAPSRWVIEGRFVGQGRGGGVITYALATEAEGTRFEREFVYTMPNAFLTAATRLLAHRRVVAESDAALLALKRRLESSYGVGTDADQ